MLAVVVFALLPVVRVGRRAAGLAPLRTQPLQHGLQLYPFLAHHTHPAPAVLLLLLLLEGQGQLRKVRAVRPLSPLEGQTAVRQRSGVLELLLLLLLLLLLCLMRLLLLLLLVEVGRGAVVVRRGVVVVQRVVRLGGHVRHGRARLTLKVKVFLSRANRGQQVKSSVKVSNGILLRRRKCGGGEEEEEEEEEEEGMNKYQFVKRKQQQQQRNTQQQKQTKNKTKQIHKNKQLTELPEIKPPAKHLTALREKN